MDLTILKKHIDEAHISPELKKEIHTMIDAEETYSPALVDKIQTLLDGTAENLIEQVANLQIQEATEEFDKQADELEKDIQEFGQEINKKVAEVDLVNVQSNLGMTQ
ncbi:MAG: hypothetical protein WCK48_02230 [bacterium]